MFVLLNQLPLYHRMHTLTQVRMMTVGRFELDTVIHTIVTTYLVEMQVPFVLVARHYAAGSHNVIPYAFLKCRSVPLLDQVPHRPPHSRIEIFGQGHKPHAPLSDLFAPVELAATDVRLVNAEPLKLQVRCCTRIVPYACTAEEVEKMTDRVFVDSHQLDNLPVWLTVCYMRPELDEMLCGSKALHIQHRMAHVDSTPTGIFMCPFACYSGSAYIRCSL